MLHREPCLSLVKRRYQPMTRTVDDECRTNGELANVTCVHCQVAVKKQRERPGRIYLADPLYDGYRLKENFVWTGKLLTMTSARIELGPHPHSRSILPRMDGPRGPAWRKKERGKPKAARMGNCESCSLSAACLEIHLMSTSSAHFIIRSR